MFVLPGNEAGGFGAPVTLSFAPAIVSDVRVGSFNAGDPGPDFPDLVVATADGRLSVMINGGTFTFQPAPASTIPVLPSAPARLVARDLNGDGNTDVVVSYQIGPSRAFGPDFVTVLLGNGFRSFGTPVNVPLGQDTWISMVTDLGDVNGDGNRDLGVTQHTTNRLILLLGNGAGVFTPQLVPNGPAGIVRAVGGDINGDGRLDLVYSTMGGVAVQLGDGQGNFAAPVLFAASAVGEVHLVDVNGDGRLDIAVGSASAPTGW